jgi:hypothetical protein
MAGSFDHKVRVERQKLTQRADDREAAVRIVPGLNKLRRQFEDTDERV